MWKTSRYFRSMEDSCSLSDDDDVISGGDDVIRGGDDYSNDVEALYVARTLKSLALRYINNDININSNINDDTLPDITANSLN